MTPKTKISDLPEFCLDDWLKTDEDMSEYLSVVMESGDAVMLADALEEIARLKGVQTPALPQTGTMLESVCRILQTLGLKLVAQPA